MVWVLILMVGVLGGCATVAWNKFSIDQQPDYGCSTGSEAGYEIWVWNCLENQRTVIYQFSGPYWRNSAKKESVACGETTDFEKGLAFSISDSTMCKKRSGDWNYEKLHRGGD